MRGLIAAISVAVLPSCVVVPRLSAHDSLYHYAEISIPRGENPIEVAFSVHAGDLRLAQGFGADPSGNSLVWLRERSNEEITSLLEEARTFIADSFALSNGDAVIESFADSLKFPTIAVLRGDPDSVDGARPGFLVGVLTFRRETTELRLLYSKTASKRLLVVVSRPGSFPHVTDLAPGDSASFALVSPSP